MIYLVFSSVPLMSSGLAACMGQVAKTNCVPSSYTQHSTLQLTPDVHWVSPTYQAVFQWTLAEGLTIQLNLDAVYLQLESDPTG